MLLEMRRLLGFTGRGLQFLFLLLLRSPFEAAMTLVKATFLQNVFNAIAQNDHARLKQVCFLFGLATLCLFLYNGSVWSFYAPFVMRMESRLRGKLFMKISGFPLERIEAISQGEWITRLNTDVQMPFSRPLHLPHAACAVVNLSLSAVLLWFIQPEVFGWVLLFVVPHIVLSQYLIAKAMPALSQRSLEATGKNTSELTALITCADLAALYDAQAYLLKRFEKSSLDLRRANMNIRQRSALNAVLVPLFGMGGYLVILIAASTWIAKGKLSFGDLTGAFQYRSAILVGSMMFINSMISIKASMAGIRRINEIMSE